MRQNIRGSLDLLSSEQIPTISAADRVQDINHVVWECTEYGIARSNFCTKAQWKPEKEDIRGVLDKLDLCTWNFCTIFWNKLSSVFDSPVSSVYLSTLCSLENRLVVSLQVVIAHSTLDQQQCKHDTTECCWTLTERFHYPIPSFKKVVTPNLDQTASFTVPQI